MLLLFTWKKYEKKNPNSLNLTNKHMNTIFAEGNGAESLLFLMFFDVLLAYEMGSGVLLIRRIVFLLLEISSFVFT